MLCKYCSASYSSASFKDLLGITACCHKEWRIWGRRLQCCVEGVCTCQRYTILFTLPVRGYRPVQPSTQYRRIHWASSEPVLASRRKITCPVFTPSSHREAWPWSVVLTFSKYLYMIVIIQCLLLFRLQTFYDLNLSRTSATFSLTPCLPSYFSNKVAVISSALAPLATRRISSSFGKPIHACG